MNDSGSWSINVEITAPVHVDNHSTFQFGPDSLNVQSGSVVTIPTPSPPAEEEGRIPKVETGGITLSAAKRKRVRTGVVVGEHDVAERSSRGLLEPA